VTLLYLLLGGVAGLVVAFFVLRWVLSPLFKR
jgi:hypothetical protein